MHAFLFSQTEHIIAAPIADAIGHVNLSSDNKNVTLLHYSYTTVHFTCMQWPMPLAMALALPLPGIANALQPHTAQSSEDAVVSRRALTACVSSQLRSASHFQLQHKSAVFVTKRCTFRTLTD